MKNFKNISPEEVASDSRVILEFEDYDKALRQSSYFYLLRDGEHFIWADKSLYPSVDGKPECWVGGSILEFPISGLRWFINTIEERFFKTAAEGGLPKGTYAYEEVVDGERLCISRMFGIPGYAFRNYSRQDHAWEDDDDNDPQQAELDDDLLFNQGLFKELKKVASKT